MTNGEVRFLAVSGSLRKNSTNTALLRALSRHVAPTSEIEVFAGIGALPLFNPDDEISTPSAVTDFARRVERCDGLIIAAPEYAHGIPGALKNALDWLVSRSEIPHKPVMLVHASGRSAMSREHLREVLRTMSARLFPGPEIELHLLGKTAAEIERDLNEQENRRHMRTVLDYFSRFAATAA